MRHQIRILYILFQHAAHPLQNVGVNIPRHIAEIRRNIAFYQRAEHLAALVVHFFHHPDAARDRNLISHRRRLDDGAELL